MFQALVESLLDVFVFQYRPTLAVIRAVSRPQKESMPQCQVTWNQESSVKSIQYSNSFGSGVPVLPHSSTNIAPPGMKS